MQTWMPRSLHGADANNDTAVEDKVAAPEGQGRQNQSFRACIDDNLPKANGPIGSEAPSNLEGAQVFRPHRRNNA